MDDTLQMITSMENAVFELDVLQDNETARIMRIYFEERKKTIDLVESVRTERGLAPKKNPLSGKENEPIRWRLRLIGFILADTFPEFSRVWNDVLYEEVDVTFKEETDALWQQ